MAITARAEHFEDDADWNEVWAEYDARAADTSGRRTERARRDRGFFTAMVQETGDEAPRARHRWRIGRAVAGAVCSAAMLIGLWAAVPYAFAARMTTALRTGDVTTLARQMEPAGTTAGLRDALRAEVPDWMTGGARRYVETLADRMSASAEARGGAARMVGLRATVRDGEALPRPETLRSATPIGATAFRLDYGPERGAGGVSFDVAWQRGEFRVVAMRLSDPPARPMPATVIAMR